MDITGIHPPWSPNNKYTVCINPQTQTVLLCIRHSTISRENLTGSTLPGLPRRRGLRRGPVYADCRPKTLFLRSSLPPVHHSASVIRYSTFVGSTFDIRLSAEAQGEAGWAGAAGSDSSTRSTPR